MLIRELQHKLVMQEKESDSVILKLRKETDNFQKILGQSNSIIMQFERELTEQKNTINSLQEDLDLERQKQKTTYEQVLADSQKKLAHAEEVIQENIGRRYEDQIEKLKQDHKKQILELKAKEEEQRLQMRSELNQAQIVHEQDLQKFKETIRIIESQNEEQLIELGEQLQSMERRLDHEQKL